MTRAANFLEAQQGWLALAAIAIGAVCSVALPGADRAAAPLVSPLVFLLLTATFLALPLTRVLAGLRDTRFITTLLVVNFLAVPAAAWLCTRLVAHDSALLTGTLLVLLAPCIDYVIVFSGAAGGDRAKLVAATPILLLAQLACVPLWLALFLGPELSASFPAAPFLGALLWFLVIPLLVAGALQAGSTRSSWAGTLIRRSEAAVVPLMCLTLAAVVTAEFSSVAGSLSALLPVVLATTLFAALMFPTGWGLARLARLPSAAQRSIAFSGMTRNSLVVLPIALALPGKAGLAPLAVVTQTLVELCLLVALTALVRRVPQG